ACGVRGAVRRAAGRGRVGVLGLGCLLVAGSTSAQDGSGRFELAGGVRWTGSLSAGKSDAEETTPSGAPSRLFATASEFAPAIGWDARVAAWLTRRVQAGAAFSYGTPSLRTRVTSDVEGAGS